MHSSYVNTLKFTLLSYDVIAFNELYIIYRVTESKTSFNIKFEILRFW